MRLALVVAGAVYGLICVRAERVEIFTQDRHNVELQTGSHRVKSGDTPVERSSKHNVSSLVDLDVEKVDKDASLWCVDDLAKVDISAVITAHELQVLDHQSMTVELFNSSVEKGDFTKRCKVVEGDMLACNKSSKEGWFHSNTQGARWGGTLWSQHEYIPFCFSPNILTPSRRSFLAAAQHVSSRVSCIGFVEVKTGIVPGTCQSSPAIYVKSDPGGCWATLGSQVDASSPFSTINLDPAGCNHLGIATHELCHALGMVHQQTRQDRDQYIKVYWDNIAPGHANEFDKYRSSDEEMKRPYDLMSIMHFDSNAFSKDPSIPTMTPATLASTMGNRMGLTRLDAKLLSDIYKCT